MPRRAPVSAVLKAFLALSLLALAACSGDDDEFDDPYAGRSAGSIYAEGEAKVAVEPARGDGGVARPAVGQRFRAGRWRDRHARRGGSRDR